MKKNSENKIINLDYLSHEVYNDSEFAKSYAGKIEYNAHNALYERPAMLALLPDIRNKTVLDAGCGPGAYSEWLINNGASVTAIDYSNQMLKLTKEKIENKGFLINANLNQPLTMLDDDKFDIVLSSMVIHYIKDWRNLFSEFNRILKVNGFLIFSTHHPFMDYSFHNSGNYFETELITDEWSSYNVSMNYFRRPLGDIFQILKESDFKVDQVLEPLPVNECRERFPDVFKTLSEKPWFICFKVIKEK